MLLLAIAALPFLAIGAVVGFRAPTSLVLPIYAALVPFGSAIVVPGPLPPPFNTLSTLLGLAALATLLARVALGGHGAPRLLPAVPLFLVFLAVSISTVAWSVDRGTTIDLALVLASLVALYVVAAVARIDAGDVRRFENAVVVGAVLACTYGFMLLFTGRLPEEEAGIRRFATAGGVDTDPNITAATLVLPLVLAVARARSSRGWTKLAAAGAAFFIATGLLLTASRGGILAAIVAIVVLVASQPHQVRAVLAAGALVVVTAVTGATVGPDQYDRLFKTGSSGRNDIWTVASYACASYCLLGSGLGSFPEVHRDIASKTPDILSYRLGLKPHNMWIGSAVETGVLSALLMLLGLAVTARSLARLPRDRRGPPLAALAGLVVSNLFISNIGFKYFWLVLIYAAIAVNEVNDALAPGAPSTAADAVPATLVPIR